MVPKLLLTPEEAADALGVGRTKLYELMAEGLVESVRIGACRRVPVAALDSFVEHLRGSKTVGEAMHQPSSEPRSASSLLKHSSGRPLGRDDLWTTAGQ